VRPRLMKLHLAQHRPMTPSLMLALSAVQAETIELSSDTEESEAEASRYDACFGCPLLYAVMAGASAALRIAHAVTISRGLLDTLSGLIAPPNSLRLSSQASLSVAWTGWRQGHQLMLVPPHRRVDGEEDALSRDMGSVAVSDESSEQRRVEAMGPRRYRLSKQELQVYRRAMAAGDREEVRQSLSCWGHNEGQADPGVDMHQPVKRKPFQDMVVRKCCAQQMAYAQRKALVHRMPSCVALAARRCGCRSNKVQANRRKLRLSLLDVLP